MNLCGQVEGDSVLMRFLRYSRDDLHFSTPRHMKTSCAGYCCLPITLVKCFVPVITTSILDRFFVGVFEGAVGVRTVLEEQATNVKRTIAHSIGEHVLRHVRIAAIFQQEFDDFLHVASG